MSNIPFRRVSRMDTHRNLITGYGTNRDHSEQFEWVESAPLSMQTLNSVYAQHPIAWKLVDLLPDDSIREGWTYDHDRADDISKELKRLQFRQRLNECGRMARLHGVNYLYIQYRGQDPAESLDWKNPGEIEAIHNIERDYCQPENLYRSLRSEFYTVGHDDIGYVRVHTDRIIPMYGGNVARDWRRRNNGSGQSIIERCWKPLLAYSISHGLIPNIIKDFIRDVIKLQGLNELAINECEEDQRDFDNRMDAMFQAQSMLNKLVLDKDDEYERSTTSVAGLNDLIRNPEKWLVATSGIPHTKLLGESPGAALSQSGNSQEKDWHKAVSAYQEDCLRPVIERVLLMITPGLGISEDIEFAFNPLDVPSEKEKAEVLDLVSKAAASMVDRGVWSIEEARTLFDSEEIKTLPTLDEKSAALLAALQGEPDGNERNQAQSKNNEESSTEA